MTYDHWKTTNPADELLGSTHQEDPMTYDDVAQRDEITKQLTRIADHLEGIDGSMGQIALALENIEERLGDVTGSTGSARDIHYIRTLDMGD